MFDDKGLGLYDKYRVIRKYDNPDHKDCKYFVLDFKHDKYAIPALTAYAISCREEYPELAQDLFEIVEENS